MHGEHNHVCTKCGWSFPNPHPSAKHRRAHKKVCGKLQGFKILEPQNNITTHLSVSDVDDDDDNDDEDHSHNNNNNNKEEETRSNNNLKGVMGRQISNRSEGGEEFSDANTEFFYTGTGSSTTTVDAAGIITSSAGQLLKATENASLIQTSSNPTDGNQLQSPHALENVEEQIEADTHQDHASSSTMRSVVSSDSDQVAASLTAEMIEATNGSKPEATANENPENSQNGENTMDSRQVEDTIRESNIDGSKSATEALAAKTASDSPGDISILISDARPAEGVLDLKEETVALGLKDPQDEISPGSEDGCNVNESLPAALDHSSAVYVGGISVTAANGFKEQELEKTEPNLIPDTCKAINEAEVHLKNPEQTHSDFLVSKSGGTADISPSAVEVLEDNLEPEEMDSKIDVEGQADPSAAKDRISENLESNGVETFLDTRTSFSHKLQELDCSQQEKTHEILPETQFVVGADCDATTISPPDSFSGKTDEVKVNVVPEESRIENSGITNRETIEQNSTKPTGDCFEVASFLSESEKSIKETESTLENQTELSGMDINENHLANTTESLSNTQVCLDESFQQGSEEIEIISNVDPPSIKKTEVNIVDTNSIIADPVHEETKLNHSSEVGFNQSGAENPIINDFMPSAVDVESCIQSPGKVEENKGKNENPIINDFTPSAVDVPGDASDAHSQSLQEKVENNILEHKSDASSAMPQDWSVDTISLTDSVEGIWGSVSDGAGPSVKGPNDVPPILAAEVLLGDTPEPKMATQTAPLEKTLDASEEQNFGNNDIYDAPSFMTLVEPGKGEDQLSASSEIRTAQNPEQTNSSSLQAGWFPSHAHAINESEGRKKNEEIIEKVTKWSSDKEHIPLRSLLVEANVESKHKLKNTQSYGQETNTSTSTQDAVLQAKTVDPPIAATPEATTIHIERDAEKEWNSPARLPISREKRKVRYWAPFLCCSSVN